MSDHDSVLHVCRPGTGGTAVAQTPDQYLCRAHYALACIRDKRNAGLKVRRLHHLRCNVVQVGTLCWPGCNCGAISHFCSAAQAGFAHLIMAGAACRGQSCSRVCWLLCSMSTTGWTLLYRSAGNFSGGSCSAGQPACMAGSAHDAATTVLKQLLICCWLYCLALSSPTHVMDSADGSWLATGRHLMTYNDLQTKKQRRPACCRPMPKRLQSYCTATWSGCAGWAVGPQTENPCCAGMPSWWSTRPSTSGTRPAPSCGTASGPSSCLGTSVLLRLCAECQRGRSGLGAYFAALPCASWR